MDRAARGMLAVARSVLAELDLEVVLERVLESARELTGAGYAALGVLGETGDELDRFLTLGMDEATREGIGDLPRGRGVLGELIRSPKPLRLAQVGRHPRSYGFPAAHPPMSTFLGVPILVGGRPYGNLYLTEKEGGAEFTAEDEDAVVLLAEFAGLAIDHAGRYTGAETRRDELERTVAALDATTQIARALGGATDLDVVLELVAKRGRALVSARTLLIELEHGESLVVAAAAGEIPDGVLGERVAKRETVASAALRTRRTQNLDDELNRTRFEQFGVGRLGVAAESGLIVPLVFQGQTYGVLVALDRLEDGPRFTADDQRLLEAFAASAATAVATAQSVADERRSQRLAAAEDERRRWARELHDETLQSLAAVQMILSAGKRSERPEALVEAADDAIELLRQETTNLRALITDLRPAALDDYGIAGAIEALVGRVASQGIEVDLRMDLEYEPGLRPTRYPPELESAVYRIAQEALTNAVKHGHAEHAHLEIREDEAAIRIVVEDDGVGFDPSSRTAGFGLLGMRERAELFGGVLEVDAAPGRGTTIRAVVPVQPADDAQRQSGS